MRKTNHLKLDAFCRNGKQTEDGVSKCYTRMCYRAAPGMPVYCGKGWGEDRVTSEKMAMENLFFALEKAIFP
ncbi:MAG: hypothetical protein PVG95_09305 [Methyloceanibacter sp.]|jgi:hypothetical protein